MSQHDGKHDKTREQEQAENPTPPVVRLAAAEVDAAAAKDRLNDTVARLQSKLDPKLIAKEATDEVRRVGDRGVLIAKENREALLGLAGGVILYLLRKPLLGVFKRRKYPKPQRAAKPMTATATNKRLAKQPHPAQAGQFSGLAAAPPQVGLTPKTPLSSTNSTATSTSNEGAPMQGTTL